jgi:hypothetical protein
VGFAKNYQNKKNHSTKSRSNKAYKPKPPFRSVEGTDSQSWDKLSPYGVYVLMEFYRKFDGHNRYDLRLSYKEVQKKIASGTFSKAIWELIGFGFLDVIRFGRLERNNSIYALTDRWKKVSQDRKKLDKIEKYLGRVEKIKHINTPSHLIESEKTDFRIRRKQLLWLIRNKVLKA